MNDLEKAIPVKFKRKFDELKEITINQIDRESINKMKKNLGALMKDEMKLVGFEFHFLSKNGILLSTGGSAEGFNKEDWEQ